MIIIIVQVKSDMGIASRNEKCKWFLFTAKVDALALASCNITIPKYSREKHTKNALKLMNKFNSAYSLIVFDMIYYYYT